MIANFFDKNFKVFFLCPILTNAPLNANKQLLDTMEGFSKIETIVKPVEPTAKKAAKFVYFSIFNKSAELSKGRISLLPNHSSFNKDTLKLILDDPLNPYSPNFVKGEKNIYLNQNHRPANSVPKRNKNMAPLIFSINDKIWNKRKRSKVVMREDDGSYEIIEPNIKLTHVPINKNADQVIEELNKKVLELELDNNKLKYMHKNIVNDLNHKINQTYQILQSFEREAHYTEVLELYNKQIKRNEKQILILRETLIKIVTSHEMAYASLGQHVKISKREQLLLNELRTLQKILGQTTIEMKKKEQENVSLKAKDRIWTMERKELEIAQKDATICKKKLARTEGIVQSTGAAKESSERMAVYLKDQYEALDLKNRENERLILALQKQIDRMNIKLSESKLARHLKDTSKIPNTEIPKDKERFKKFFALLIDKNKLSELHSQAMKCKTQIKEDLKVIRNEAKAYNCANLNLTADSLKQTTNVLLDIVTKLELRELRYINKISWHKDIK